MRMALAVLVALAAIPAWGAPPSPWRALAPGLEVAELLSPVPSTVGDSKVVVVRIDPVRYAFKLLSRKELALPANLTAPQWVEKHGLVGAINASMYQTDYQTSVSYMKNGAFEVQKRVTKDNAVFAAEPLDDKLPRAQIIDRTCQDFEALRKSYRILAQNIRMLGCQGENTWQAQDRRWSTACVGQDQEGRILFIHARSPWSTHDLIEILKKLPLSLVRLMYVEGGPEASLYVRSGAETVSRVGSFETAFLENDDNQAFWPVPNVIGIVAR